MIKVPQGQLPVCVGPREDESQWNDSLPHPWFNKGTTLLPIMGQQTQWVMVKDEQIKTDELVSADLKPSFSHWIFFL